MTDNDKLRDALQACLDYGSMTGGEWVEMKARAALAAQPSREVAPTPVLQVFREALSWGRVYGEALPANQWDELRDQMAQQFASRLAPAPVAVGLTDEQIDALWKKWSLSPCEDGWHQQRETYRLKAAFAAGLAALNATPSATAQDAGTVENERAAKTLTRLGYKYQAGMWGYVGAEPERRKHLGAIINRLADLTKLEAYAVKGQGEREFIDRDPVMSAAQAIAAAAYALLAAPSPASAPAAEVSVSRKIAQRAVNHASLGVPGSLAQATAMLDGETRPALPAQGSGGEVATGVDFGNDSYRRAVAPVDIGVLANEIYRGAVRDCITRVEATHMIEGEKPLMYREAVLGRLEDMTVDTFSPHIPALRSMPATLIRPASPAPAQGAGGARGVDFGDDSYRRAPAPEHVKAGSVGSLDLNPLATLAAKLKGEAREVFDGPETSQDVRDVIEWYTGSILAAATQARPSAEDVRDAGRWQVLELVGLIDEYVACPCASLRERMVIGAARAKKRLDATPPAAQENGQ